MLYCHFVYVIYLRIWNNPKNTGMVFRGIISFDRYHCFSMERTGFYFVEWYLNSVLEIRNYRQFSVRLTIEITKESKSIKIILIVGYVIENHIRPNVRCHISGTEHENNIYKYWFRTLIGLILTTGIYAAALMWDYNQIVTIFIITGPAIIKFSPLYLCTIISPISLYVGERLWDGLAKHANFILCRSVRFWIIPKTEYRKL